MRNNKDPFVIVMGLIVILVFTAFVGTCSAPLWTQDTTTFTVKDKERVSSGSSGYFLVYTNTETFTNRDALVVGKFDSADLQGSLDVGTTYRATVCGWRVPFLSMYRNILTIQKENTDG